MNHRSLLYAQPPPPPRHTYSDREKEENNHRELVFTEDVFS